VVAARADLDPMRGDPQVCHTGVVWQGVPTAAQRTPVPRILVSLSTCAFAGQRRMLQNILDAVAPLDVETIVTVGPGIDAAGLRVPENATMHAWLDHDEVLSTASLVVGHGGHSTAMRALSFGVPQVVMPANPMIDQKGVGAALQRAGAGILLPKHARPKRIRAAIQAVLTGNDYREAAERLGADIRQRNGADVAADAIEEFVRSQQLVDS
jgi:MGT family glycosyltransferase